MVSLLFTIFSNIKWNRQKENCLSFPYQSFSIAAAIDDGGAGEGKVGASQVTKFDGLTPEKVVPAGYNRAIPPNLALGREGPTNVTINTSVYTMDSISEKTMVTTRGTVHISFIVKRNTVSYLF